VQCLSDSVPPQNGVSQGKDKRMKRKGMLSVRLEGPHVYVCVHHTLFMKAHIFLTDLALWISQNSQMLKCLMTEILKCFLTKIYFFINMLLCFFSQ